MIEISLTVSKTQVYNEVAKTTSYAGSKMEGDENAYQRIFTTDEDREMLERFWREACSLATGELKPWLKSVSSQPVSQGVDLTKNYVVVLNASGRYDTSLTDSISAALFSYFVDVIVSKWYKFTNKAEAETYAAEAVGMMDDVMRKLYWKKKPELAHGPDPEPGD